MLLSTLVLLWSAGDVAAWYSAQCSGPQPDPEKAVTIAAATDGVRARYVVTYCTESTPPPIKWTLWMNTLHTTPEHCTYDFLQEKRPGNSHSESLEFINSTSINASCPYVCFSKAMDLIHEACYRLENQVFRQGPRSNYSSEPFHSYHYIKNGIEPLTSAKHYVYCYDLTDSDTQVVCRWLEGEIPFTDYEVTLEPNTTTNEDAETVTRNCTREGGATGSVRCQLSVASEGAWVLRLRHVAPWTRGFNHLVQHSHVFMHTPNSVPVLEPTPSSSMVWASGAAGLLCVSLLAGLLAYQKRRQAKARLELLQRWLASRAEAEAGQGEKERAPGSVLLLYARDCPRVATALTTALREQNKGQVFDLYSPEILSLAAPSPHSFVRSCLQRPNIRIVLLQTPALQALYSVPNVAPSTPLNMEDPLLPRGVMYRAPLFGDQLVQYALQLIGETNPAPAPGPYRKYHLASISGLEVDVFPAIVPYTRYELPAALPALVHALWPPETPGTPAVTPTTPGDPATRELEQAARELVEFARDNPNYLEQYLMFVE